MAAGTIFVGDMSVCCSENHVFELFKDYGTVMKIELRKHKEVHKLQGFAFVTMSTIMESENAMSALNGVMFLGRRLRIHWANSPEPMKDNKCAEIAFSFISRQLDYLVYEQTLRDLFSQYDCDVLDVKIKQYQIDTYKLQQNGTGFIHFPLSHAGVLAVKKALVHLCNVCIENIDYDTNMSNTLTFILRENPELDARYDLNGLLVPKPRTNKNKGNPMPIRLGIDLPYVPLQYLEHLVLTDRGPQQNQFGGRGAGGGRFSGRGPVMNGGRGNNSPPQVWSPQMMQNNGGNLPNMHTQSQYGRTQQSVPQYGLRIEPPAMVMSQPYPPQQQQQQQQRVSPSSQYSLHSSSPLVSSVHHHQKSLDQSPHHYQVVTASPRPLNQSQGHQNGFAHREQPSHFETNNNFRAPRENDQYAQRQGLNTGINERYRQDQLGYNSQMQYTQEPPLKQHNILSIPVFTKKGSSLLDNEDSDVEETEEEERLFATPEPQTALNQHVFHSQQFRNQYEPQFPPQYSHYPPQSSQQQQQRQVQQKTSPHNHNQYDNYGAQQNGNIEFVTDIRDEGNSRYFNDHVDDEQIEAMFQRTHLNSK